MTPNGENKVIENQKDDEKKEAKGLIEAETPMYSTKKEGEKKSTKIARWILDRYFLFLSNNTSSTNDDPTTKTKFFQKILRNKSSSLSFFISCVLISYFIRWRSTSKKKKIIVSSKAKSKSHMAIASASSTYDAVKPFLYINNNHTSRNIKPENNRELINLNNSSNVPLSVLLNTLEQHKEKEMLVKRSKNKSSENWLFLFPFMYLGLVYKMLKNLSKDPTQDTQRTGNIVLNNNKITFENIAGLRAAKTELQEVTDLLRIHSSSSLKSSKYQRMGVRLPRGVLLYGPPGTGKTLLAKAVAGEIGTHCLFYECNGSEFVEVLVGRGAKRVRDLFQNVKIQARNKYYRSIHSFQRQERQRKQQKNPKWTDDISESLSSFYDQLQEFSGIMYPPSLANNNDASVINIKPCAIVFIDEIDTLAKSRQFSLSDGGSGGANDEREQTLNQLLAEMDGFSSSSDVNICVIAATNRPNILDPSIMRSGRFDRHIYVSLPDLNTRKAILKLHAKTKPLASHDIKWDAISLQTKGFSGADLENVVNEAGFFALRDDDLEITQKHLLRAVEKVKVKKNTPTNNFSMLGLLE